MPKVKKHPTLPNGFGSIRLISKKRSNPYAVHPPASRRDDNGHYIREKAICYVPDWYTGFAVLTAYHAGTYTPGMEVELCSSRSKSVIDLDDFCKQMISNFNMIKHSESYAPVKTFKNVADEWYESRFGKTAVKKKADNTMISNNTSINQLKSIWDKNIKSLQLDDLQECINSTKKLNGEPLSKGSTQVVVTALKSIFKYALKRDYIDKNYAVFVEVPDREDGEETLPIWDNELEVLWKNKDDDIVKSILIMCYTGMRLSEFDIAEFDLENMCVSGGLKTKAGRTRIVPVHSAIQPLLLYMLEKYGSVHEYCNKYFSQTIIGDTLEKYGFPNDRTAHSCRHTFSRLCEKYHVPEMDRKRMIGHSIKDITNGIYGHRTLEELRESIEMIEV